jgi:hypothetical protein
MRGTALLLGISLLLLVPLAAAEERRAVVVAAPDVDLNNLRENILPVVGRYFEEASYGRVRFTFTVLGEQVGLGANPEHIPFREIVESLAPFIDYRSYNHLVYLQTGGWENIRGHATRGANYYPVDGGVCLGVVSCYPSPSIIAHELTHNLGLGDLYEAPHEVGPWDIMGKQVWVSREELSFPHPLAYSKLRLGWLSEENIAEVWRTGIVAENFRLPPLEFPGEGVRAIRIHLSNGTHYYVEYRRAAGVSVLTDNGVLIYSVDQSGTVRVADLTPGTSLNDAVFRENQSLKLQEEWPWEEPHFLRVEVLEEGENGALVRVCWMPYSPTVRVDAGLPSVRVRIDNEEVVTDSGGLASARVWPGRVRVKIPEKVELENGVGWFNPRWEDGEASAERSVDVFNDILLRVRYEKWGLVEVRVRDGLGLPLDGVEVLGEKTDMRGEVRKWVPAGRNTLSIDYLGQHVEENFWPPSRLEVEVPYGPQSLSLCLSTVLLTFLLDGWLLRRWLG